MKKTLLLVAAALLFTASSAFAQSGSTTAISTLIVTVAPEAGMTVTSDPTFNAPTNFSNFTGTTTFTYWIRTGNTGSPQITVYISTDFSDGSLNQPSVAHPPPGDALTYACSMTAPTSGSATGCTSGQVATTVAGSATNVATFGTNTHSPKAGATGNTVTWTLPNDPLYPTASYTAKATFTISAT